MGQLHAADVLQCDVPPDTEELFSRHQREQRQKWKKRLMNPLAVRIPLLDPDRFLETWLPFVRPFFGWFGFLIWAGIVVAGLTYGQVLYKIAPLNDYRVVLEVDERDFSDVALGQTGNLALAAAPNDRLEIVVNKITPVSTPQDGSNFFRVEASLADPPKFLRPGMQGVGTVDIGERRRIWIWTHRIVNWLRLSLWSWWP